MYESWYRKLGLSNEEINTIYAGIIPRTTRFMSTEQLYKARIQLSLNVSNQNSQYRTIGSELEEASNFFMKRFTVRT